MTSPFAVSTLLWERRPGEPCLTICAKATFTLAPGEAPLVPHFDGVHDDVHWDAGAPTSLYSPSDFVPFKPRVDVLLVGAARAPEGVPQTSLVVGLHVDAFSKRLLVTGDRAWVRSVDGLRPSAPRPFVEMPLRYETATKQGDNPIGISARGPFEAGQPLPNVEPIDPSKPDTTPGFGPIALGWRARRLRADEGALSWAQRVRSRPGPASPSLDFGLFNAAPSDQQLAAPSASPVIVLENLVASTPRLETRLPPISPRASLPDPVTGRMIEVPLHLDTLWIDANRGMVIASWRGVTANVTSALAAAQVVVSGAPGEETTLPLLSTPARESVPFAPPRESVPFAPPRESAPFTPPRESALPPAGIPFTPARESALPPAGRVSVVVRPSEEPEATPAAEEPSTAPMPDEPAPSGGSPPGAGALPFQPGKAAPEIARPSIEAPRVKRSAVEVFASETTVVVDTVARPPLPFTAPAPKILPMERYAAICAELWNGFSPRAEVLRRNDVSESDYDACDEHYGRALDHEAREGRCELAMALGKALREARADRLPGGEIDRPIDEYARLSVEIDAARDPAPVLAANRLTADVWKRIERRWAQRTAASQAIAEDLELRLAAARKALYARRRRAARRGLPG